MIVYFKFVQISVVLNEMFVVARKAIVKWITDDGQ